LGLSKGGNAYDNGTFIVLVRWNNLKNKVKVTLVEEEGR
jgi:hypothetical protein